VRRDGLGQLEVERLDEAAASLRWRSLPGLLTYTVTCRSDNPLETPRSRTTTLSSVAWADLAPDTAYTFTVWGNRKSGGRTAASTVRVRTQGPGLPAPNLLLADLAPGYTTSVKLSWSLPNKSGGRGSTVPTSNLSYGIWFGASEEDLLAQGPRSLVSGGATTWTERNLTACTTYIFAVAVVLKGTAEPNNMAGVLMGAAGPRSNYKTVTTKFSQVN
jgi:hypothetical protein